MKKLDKIMAAVKILTVIFAVLLILSGVTKIGRLEAYASDLKKPVITEIKSYDYNAVKITWSKVKGADKYQVYRSKSRDGKYSLIKTTSQRSFINKNLTTGTRYFYKVRAVDNGVKGKFSSIKSAVPELKKPVISVKSKRHSSVTLDWKNVNGASGYRVYRSTSRKGTYKRIKTVTVSQYMDSSAQAGKTYYYKVRAYKKLADGDYKYSDYSEAAGVSVSAHTWRPMCGLVDYGHYAEESCCLICGELITGEEEVHIGAHMDAGEHTYAVEEVSEEVQTWVSDIETVDKGYYKVEQFEEVCHFCNDCGVRFVCEKDEYGNDKLNEYGDYIFVNEAGETLKEHILSHIEDDPVNSSGSYTTMKDLVEVTVWVSVIEEVDNGYWVTERVTKEVSFCGTCGEDITGYEETHLRSFECAVCKVTTEEWIPDIKAIIRGYKCRLCGVEKKYNK